MLYLDPKQPVEQRVDDLLSRMTAQEKIGQLRQCIFGWKALDINKETREISITEELQKEINFADGLGGIYGLMRSDPWTKADFSNGLLIQDSRHAANLIQRYIRDHTRLGIPVLFSEEAPHGHTALEGTLFPTSLGIGSTWNPALYQKIGNCIACEVRNRGAHITLISALDMALDPRWGRFEECFSEDPYLASRMAEAITIGVQGKNRDLTNMNRAAAVLKHFAAQGSSTGGHNGKNATIGERELRELHLPAMKAAVQAGVSGCMAAYNAIDGVYCHASKWLLRKVLRDEWHLEGIVMSDGCAVDNLQVISGDPVQAVSMAIKAGVDLDLWNQSFRSLPKALEEGLICEDDLNRAAGNVLGLKFRLGLFEQTFDDDKTIITIDTLKEHHQISLQAARESVVLLKNDHGLLPLSQQPKRIAVIGPNADAQYNQLGDYSSAQKPGVCITVLEGIKKIVPDSEIFYVKGCDIRGDSSNEVEKAVDAASHADAIILVLGGSSTRDFGVQFDLNGAALPPLKLSDMDCGEGMDVADVSLGGSQMELAVRLAGLGKPLISVLIQGRAHAVEELALNSSALLCAWYPGPLGGQAISEIIFGQYNPSGRLPVSIPRSSHQLPVHYNLRPSTDYIDSAGSALYTFGHGLSYTTFSYDHMKLNPACIDLDDLVRGKTVKVSLDLKNTGQQVGQEVVQLYIRDLVSSICRRKIELKAFSKISLKPGESKTICLELGFDELALWNPDMQFIVEQGQFEIIIGQPDQIISSDILTVVSHN